MLRMVIRPVHVKILSHVSTEFVFGVCKECGSMIAKHEC